MKKANASKTTTKIVDVTNLKGALGIQWKVEKVIEGGNSAIVREHVGDMPTERTAYAWKDSKGNFVPLQTKKTKVGLITSRI